MALDRIGLFCCNWLEYVLSLSLSFPFCLTNNLAPRADPPSGSTLGHCFFTSCSQLTCHVGLGTFSGLRACVTWGVHGGSVCGQLWGSCMYEGVRLSVSVRV